MKVVKLPPAPQPEPEVVITLSLSDAKRLLDILGKTKYVDADNATPNGGDFLRRLHLLCHKTI